MDLFHPALTRPPPSPWPDRCLRTINASDASVYCEFDDAEQFATLAPDGVLYAANSAPAAASPAAADVATPPASITPAFTVQKRAKPTAALPICQ